MTNSKDWTDCPLPYYRGAIINAYFELLQHGDLFPVVACYDLTKESSYKKATELPGWHFENESAPMLVVGIPSRSVKKILGDLPGFDLVDEFHAAGLAAVVMFVGDIANWISMPIPTQRFDPANN